MSLETATSPADDRPVHHARVPREVRGAMDMLMCFGRWHMAVMALDTVPGPVVEVGRLRAAKHHDCHT